MATLSRFPIFLSLSSHKVLFYHKKHHQLNWNWSTHECPPQKHLTICASSINRKPRVSRKVKSNEELCNEIREFVSVVGLPEGHIPSIKELSEHGRNDLANIVRRRGYKFITELLASSTRDIDEFNAEKCADEKQNAVGDRKDILTDQDEKVSNVVEDESLSTKIFRMENYPPTLDDSTCLNLDNDICTKENEVRNLTSLNGEVNNVVEVSSIVYHPTTLDISTYLDSDDHIYTKENAMRTLTSQNDEVNNMVEDVSLSTSVPVTESCCSSLNTNPDLNSDDNGCMSVESSSTSSLEQNTSIIIKDQNENANNIAENIFLLTSASTMENYSNSLNDSVVLKPDDNHYCMYGESSTTSNLEEKVAKFIQDGNLDAIEDNDYANEPYGGKSKELIQTEDSVETQSRVSDEDHSKHDYSSSRINDGLTSNRSILALNQAHRYDHPKARDTDFHNDLNFQTISRGNQVEINQLKFLLHQRELELSRLKEQIKKEKVAMSVLQTKAETEINKAQKLITEKDAEFDAAEESLSGLQEVEIQYSGDGEVVEVAGSFNGWHHRIKMDPPPSSIIESIGSRNGRWSTVLWLYPGTYEIKFIVDGQWRIDPQRESVTKGNISNNILQVDREG